MAGMPDMLSIVEAAYAVEAPVRDWTGGLLSATNSSIGTGLGGFACEFHANADGTMAIDRTSAAALNQPPETVNAIFDGLTHAPPGWLSSYTANPRSASFCVLTSEVDPNFHLAYRDRLASHGVHDGINVACMDLDRRGVLISLGVGEGEHLPPPVRHNLARVATHIVAGLRLRGRVQNATLPKADRLPSAADPGDAILSPEGKLLHADGEAKLASARRALQKAVSDVENARTSLRGDVERALGLWKGLVSARWTLIDQFDEHGVKYIVARENSPTATVLSKLTSAEHCVVMFAARGFSTKEIAYTLGISPATVRVLLMRAARRCGVKGRRELLKLGLAASKLVAPAVPPPPGGSRAD
jgi:DNA-binding CsgD family transcriptional regulator